MKKLSFIVLILLVSFVGTYAQKFGATTRKNVDKDVPVAVLAAVETGHPGLVLQQQLVESPPVLKKKKASKPPTPTAQLYQVIISAKNYHKRELYNGYGDLIYSKEKIRNTALPLAIRQYIGREYNGWLVKKDLAVRTISRDGKETRYYKIVVKQGKKKQHLRLDEHGEIYARE